MSKDIAAEESAVVVSAEPETHPQRPRGHVRLFGTWCKGCGICIEFCPQGVFEADHKGRAFVAHAVKCTACHWCDTHCPDMAITVRRLDPSEAEELRELAELAEQGALPAGGDL